MADLLDLARGWLVNVLAAPASSKRPVPGVGRAAPLDKETAIALAPILEAAQLRAALSKLTAVPV